MTECIWPSYVLVFSYNTKRPCVPLTFSLQVSSLVYISRLNHSLQPVNSNRLSTLPSQQCYKLHRFDMTLLPIYIYLPTIPIFREYTTKIPFILAKKKKERKTWNFWFFKQSTFIVLYCSLLHLTLVCVQLNVTFTLIACLALLIKRCKIWCAKYLYFSLWHQAN